MKVAACKYPIGEPRDFAAFAARQAALLGEAKARGAQLAVLPEYLSLELAAMFDDAIRGDLHASLAAIQPLRDDWLSLYAGLARELGIGIVAGSFLLDMGRGRYRNRSDFFAADGGHLWQDKLRLTGFEKRTGVIDSGDALKVFDAGGVRAGIAVCYDSEFPLPVRAQCEAGARLLLVPSCTDTDAGATRVRVGCLARALENRCFVAQAVTAGEAPWSPALDTNTGEAALIAPMDVGLPSDGMLVQTRGSEAWAIAEL
ncbi:MAG TPA: carbon-nitrogen hydrolase family protein, partial [Thermomonas sp.]|nr:carbon-nitrogen hydrolase family protein [Thermomonas sp.]